MSSVTPVPERAGTCAGPLAPRDAWASLRRCGAWRLLRESFVRFRYGDGFSHSRALGLQLSLAAIPLVIAAVGVASGLRSEGAGLVLRKTILQLTPAASDALIRATLFPMSEGTRSNEVALALGTLFAAVALTTGMAQLERGANRIYGIQRDRPTVARYTRALLLACLAGLPVTAGFVLLVTAGAFSDAVESIYGVDDDLVALLTRPLGVALLVVAITVMLRYSPARRQPEWSMLALVGLVAVALWMALTALLAAVLAVSADVGNVYGPLTGVMALLLWAQLTAGAIFLALALAAQLEAASVAPHHSTTGGADDAAPSAQEVVAVTAVERMSA